MIILTIKKIKLILILNIHLFINNKNISILYHKNIFKNLLLINNYKNNLKMILNLCIINYVILNLLDKNYNKFLELNIMIEKNYNNFIIKINQKLLNSINLLLKILNMEVLKLNKIKNKVTHLKAKEMLANLVKNEMIIFLCFFLSHNHYLSC
jgi:hypothetical protein